MKAEPRTRTRLYAIDNLRIVLTVLVVAHHVAVTYGNIPLWFYTEPAKDASGGLLDLLVMFDQAFFMGFFFLISGFFTPGSHDRKGGRSFVRDRLIRLGIPLLVFLVLLRPLVNFGGFAGREGMPYWHYYIGSWDPGPMWFAEVLIVFALAYALWRSRRAPLEQRAEPLRAKWIVLYVLGLAAVTFLWRIPVPTGTYVPVLGLPSPQFLPQYASMFALGCVAFRRGWFETLPARAGRLGFVAAGVSSAVLVPLLFVTGGALSSAVSALWESAFAVSMIIGLTVWFRERFNRQGPRGRFLADHAYTVYVIHPLVLVGLGWAFRWLEAIAIVKFAIVLALALPLCWWIAYLARSLPGAKRVL
ncbi:Peptidoglycan/LPS O-acetylase OafA/YrhL, contains acyltransferase and SGNH-hydrolase domains [Nonomuraea solani]|uniref:Peptidoglycan/LPS O-acetylase OafA/YrhL, contains acyltransferase and SGNH-hydrolase domains n=2 Tax=Nonomuraea solani TaxID=1144553 RepID=A0A1H6ERP8_9ACTN|nr:Peptidoglycan/LPS O-acetylase OafA/YrhL, contains acyltransferase and SGNH-hydrolase domains [Nonomuraea solani]